MTTLSARIVTELCRVKPVARDRTLAARFFRKVIIGSSEECWLWIGSKNQNGYGRFSVDYKTQASHRVAYWLHHGTPPPPWLCVCHTCDNPSCVNPAHLWAGTISQNMLDASAKGRLPRKGIKHVLVRTHCKKGHELAMPTGSCRTCRNLSYVAYRKRKRAAVCAALGIEEVANG